MDTIAHITENGRKQKLKEHLEGAARMARNFAQSFHAADWGNLSGLWHDIGKYSKEFQDRIQNINDPNAHIESRSRRPDHSSAGAQHAHRQNPFIGRILAYCIAGHHAGLPDGRSNSASCLDDRLKKSIPDFSACPENILKASLPEPFSFKLRKGYTGFQTAFFIRMLYSCLTDADFLDTENFMDLERAQKRGGYPHLTEIHNALTTHLGNFKDQTTLVNQRRADVLGACRKAAEKPVGIFSLTVPTGGGKTLSSLDFALRHALHHGLRRVIFVIPYTSIIEQTAAVFRNFLEKNGISSETVLEHHCNFEPETEDHRSRLAAENWDAPLIVTTNVQFFESLFHNRSSRCRKLHNIAESVVILDEAQMLPVHLLLPCMEAIRELTTNYKTSAVLCTATQPALQKRNNFRFGFQKTEPIILHPEKLYQDLKRVKVEYPGVCSDDEIILRIQDERQALCVVNTQAHARALFEAMDTSEDNFHLSAAMCPVHRKEKLDLIREKLKSGNRCRVISTQLIEAGVDVDFPLVFRSVSGIDSIAQAAGRCNREGSLDAPGRVFIFTPENIKSPDFLRLNIDAAETVFRHHSDPLTLEAVQEYFETLLWRKGMDALDKHEILAKLNEDWKRLNFPFKKIAGLFRLIDDEKKPVIIPFDDKAKKWIKSLRYAENAGALLRHLQSYTVAVFPHVLKKLETAKSIEQLEKHPQAHILSNESLYDKQLGLCHENPEFHDPVSLIL